ncbi:MAG TPA: family 43 glycosylhydrolase [Ktedonobacteraceae bacterium]|nr:family 43 glycosylhydrolase [Ktedonobacteraceae bacterium]
MKRRTLFSISTLLLGALLLSALSSAFWLNTQQAHAALSGDLGAHDPALIRQGNTYYVFATGGGLQIRTSPNGVNWTYAGTVFSTIPAWISQTVGSTVTDLWAPDIHYVNGVYYLYYAGSVFGKNTSVIGLATNTTLDPHSASYHWVDQGLVLHSTSSNNYNAIDPNLTFDAQGNPWLAFGSFWTGLKLRRVDPQTFKLSSSDTTTYSLASNPNGDAIEASYLIYRGGYYYLFASIGLCCRGTQSTYQTVVGRATSITGPYYNEDGNRMGTSGDFTILLTSSGNAIGPGGESVYLDNGTYLLIYHYYDGNANGAVRINIVDLSWNGNWPQIGPGIGTPTPAPTSTPVRTPTPTSTPVRTPTTAPTPTATSTPVSGASCRVSYTTTNWTGGFTANIIITNTGATTINGWTLVFSFPGSQQITQVWNATVSQSGQQVTLRDAGYNASIAPGATANPGFNGSWSGSNPNPTAFTLNGSACSVG